MKDLLHIGRFSQLCRLTVKALRHYDELGLLRPAMVDTDTGYRYYSLAQAPEAECIAQLRALEMPLADIRRVIHERDPAAIREHLDRHRQRIEERVARQQRALDTLQRLIDQQQGLVTYEVLVKQGTAQQILGVRTRMSFSTIGEVMGGAFGEIFGYLGQMGVRPVGTPMMLYHDEEFREEDFEVEICVPVERPLSGRGRLAGRELPGGPLACTMHAGPFDGIGAAYQAVMNHVQEQGLIPAGPPREIYLVGPGQVPDPAEYRTEVAWPVRDDTG